MKTSCPGREIDPADWGDAICGKLLQLVGSPAECIGRGHDDFRRGPRRDASRRGGEVGTQERALYRIGHDDAGPHPRERGLLQERVAAVYELRHGACCVPHRKRDRPAVGELGGELRNTVLGGLVTPADDLPFNKLPAVLPGAVPVGVLVAISRVAGELGLQARREGSVSLRRVDRAAHQVLTRQSAQRYEPVQVRSAFACGHGFHPQHCTQRVGAAPGKVPVYLGDLPGPVDLEAGRSQQEREAFGMDLQAGLHDR